MIQKLFFCDTLEEYPNPLLGECKRAEREPLARLATEFYQFCGWNPDTGLPEERTAQSSGLDEEYRQLGNPV